MNAIAAQRAEPAAEAPALPPALVAQLPAAGAPWRLDGERFSGAEMQRWRVLLVRGADGSRRVLADRPPEPLLWQAVEVRVDAAVAWQRCETGLLDAALQAAAQAIRALDLVRDDEDAGAGSAAAAADMGVELSAARLGEDAHPVVKLLDATLYDALQAGASDIHVECEPGGARVLYRVDGLLGLVHRIEGRAPTEQLVSRLKVMGELDIGERRLPQDGRFKLRLPQREVDFRLSILPGVHGEDAVVRVLDRAQLERAHGALTLAALGLDSGVQRAVRALAQAPHGMLLVAGPTGSGKTTTLYAALVETRREGEKTITIEDPVEYLLPGALQIPVNERKGLGFARGLRSVLRHDPDRILVGEIRDAETAEIAFQAALTGHVVYSTVHANGALEVIGRFTHMGLDPYHVVSALNGVLAQRPQLPHVRRPAVLRAVQRRFCHDLPARFGHEAQGLASLDPPDEPVGPGFRRDIVLQEESVLLRHLPVEGKEGRLVPPLDRADRERRPIPEGERFREPFEHHGGSPSFPWRRWTAHTRGPCAGPAC